MKKGFLFLYILALCFSPMVISASSTTPTTKMIHLTTGEAIEMDADTRTPYHLTFSGFYDKSIVFEWRNVWSRLSGKTVVRNSVNDLYYYPNRTGFSFTLPENSELTATIMSIDSRKGTITLELKKSNTKENSI